MDLKSFAETYWSMQEKKLDPVGKEDGDVDNDGDKDSSDSYLMKRRKAIAKAMKKEEAEKEETEVVEHHQKMLTVKLLSMRTRHQAHLVLLKRRKQFLSNLLKMVKNLICLMR